MLLYVAMSYTLPKTPGAIPTPSSQMARLEQMLNPISKQVSQGTDAENKIWPLAGGSVCKWNSRSSNTEMKLQRNCLYNRARDIKVLSKCQGDRAFLELSQGF